MPTPQERTAAFLAVMHAEIKRKEHHPVNDTTVCLPATELFNIDGLASVDVVTWHCRICNLEGTAKYRPAANTAAVAHLVDQHRSTINTT